jgi:hypothetical protein
MMELRIEDIHNAVNQKNKANNRLAATEKYTEDVEQSVAIFLSKPKEPSRRAQR